EHENPDHIRLQFHHEGDASVTHRNSLRRTLLFLGVILLGVAPVFAADVSPGWGEWWLPPDRSVHGQGIDSLFMVTFWITMISFIAVELCLLVFLVKYRHRPEKKKAHFTHGNTRLEMAWTLAPAVILAGLAVPNKGVW